MLLFWKIRYLDSRTRQFDDRDLWLETNELTPDLKAAVELLSDSSETASTREILRFRGLFRERKLDSDESRELIEGSGMNSFSLPDYFEDENGNELTNKQMAVILTGNPDAVMFPPGMRPYDIQYAMSDRAPIPVEQINLTEPELLVLGYFARDLREMMSSTFFREGPGTLSSSGHANPEFQTAVSDEEIRSFVTIFRRLYMQKEPAGFLKAVDVFCRATAGIPIAKWVRGNGDHFKSDLEEPPQIVPFLNSATCPFTRKRLIDVYLYTQYAHQPDPKRIRQFQDCLMAVGKHKAVLAWVFFAELWALSTHIRNAGVVIANFFDRYCEHHQLSANILDSLSADHPGFGVLETKHAKRERLFSDKVATLAKSLWEENGCPDGGPRDFVQQARQALSALLSDHEQTAPLETNAPEEDH